MYFFSLAFTYMKDFHKAAACYKKACELEPENEGYRKNYELTMNNLARSATQGHSANEPGVVPIPFMDTASRMINNPEITSMYAIILVILVVFLLSSNTAIIISIKYIYIYICINYLLRLHNFLGGNAENGGLDRLLQV